MIVFDDDPQNLWPYSENGRCPTCDALPPDRVDVRVSCASPELAKFFANMPFAADPLHRKLERIALLMSLAEGDGRGAENLVTCLFERHVARFVEPLGSVSPA